MKSTKQNARGGSLDENGFRLLISEMVRGAITDLAVLRRSGFWFDDPEEVYGNFQTLQRDPEQKNPARILKSQGSHIDVSIAARPYMQTLADLCKTMFEMNFSVDQFIAAAKRESEVNKYVRAKNHKRLAAKTERSFS